MITALATVVTVTETSQGFQLELSCKQQTSCSHCRSKSSCGTGIVSNAVGNKSHLWQLSTIKDVKVGQVVEIGLPEKSLIQFASLVYLLPLAMLILGAFIGQSVIAPILGGGEAGTILGSLISLAAGVWLARRLTSRLRTLSEQPVELVRVLGDKIETQTTVR